MNADGTWSYISSADIGDSPVSDDFTYTLIDGDSDTDTAFVPITVNPNLLVVGSNENDEVEQEETSGAMHSSEEN